jgi:hypothetical protein
MYFFPCRFYSLFQVPQSLKINTYNLHNSAACKFKLWIKRYIKYNLQKTIWSTVVSACNFINHLREQMANDNGLLLHEIDEGQCPEKRGISDSDPTYKSYWTQWKSLAVRGSMLEHHCQSTDWKKKMAQIVIFRIKFRKLVAQMRIPFRVHLGVNKTTDSQAVLLLAELEGQCGEVVSSVWHLCNQPRAQNHKSGHWSILWEDLHRHRWTLPRVTGKTATSWSPWTSPSGQKSRTSPTKTHWEWKAPWWPTSAAQNDKGSVVTKAKTSNPSWCRRSWHDWSQQN